MSKEIVDVAPAQGRVGRHEDRADLCERELQDDPLGHVRRPEHDALARRDADGHQAARDRARLALEGVKCVTRAARVDERLVLRQRTRQARQEIADGDITKWWLAHRGRIVPQ